MPWGLVSGGGVNTPPLASPPHLCGDMVGALLWLVLKLLAFLAMAVFMLWVGFIEMKANAQERAQRHLTDTPGILGSLESLIGRSPLDALRLLSGVVGLGSPDPRPGLYPLFDAAVVSKLIDLFLFVQRNELADLLWHWVEDEDVTQLALHAVSG